MYSQFRSLGVRRGWWVLSLLLAATVSMGRAAEPAPLAIVSLRAPDQLISDVEYLLEATGTAPFGQLILPRVKAYLQGIDGQKPIGLVVSVDGDSMLPMGFVPVTNLKAFLTQLEPQLGTPTDAGDGVQQLQGPRSIFIKEKAGWAFVAQAADDLQQVPADPRQVLGEMDTQYDLAIRAHIENIPDSYKQMALTQIKAGLEQGLASGDDSNARAMAEAQVSQLTQLIEEAGQLTLGWGVDREGATDLSGRFHDGPTGDQIGQADGRRPRGKNRLCGVSGKGRRDQSEYVGGHLAGGYSADDCGAGER